MLRVGILQLDVQVGDRKANFSRVNELLRRAFVPSKLPTAIVLPELWDTGYALEKAQALASDEGKETATFLGDLAKKYNTWFIGGSTLAKTSAGIKNRAQVIDPRGELIAYYDKVHRFPLMDEDKYLAPGDRDCIFNWEGFESGCVICYDLRFCEWIRCYALKGIKALFISAEWPAARAKHWDILLKARAIENQMYVISCNRCGSTEKDTFDGGSLVVDPWGEVLLDAGNLEGLWFVDIDISKVDQARSTVPVFKDRVPTLYVDITK